MQACTRFATRTRIRAVCGLALLLAAGRVLAAAPVIFESVKASVRSRVDYGYNAGIVVGMVNRDGRTIFSHGRRSLDDDKIVDEQTLFEIGSVTKVFTATLLAEMVDRGEVTLADSVQSLLPPDVDVPMNGAEISLQHLATHISGFPANPDNLEPADGANPFAGYTVENLYAFLTGHILAREPGAVFEYSNLGFGLLGHALALRLGQPYETALRERILDPMGMSNTRINLTASQTLRRATGHSGVVPRPPFIMDSLESAGGLLSTASDLLTFLEFQMKLQTNALQSAVTNTQRFRRATAYPGIGIGLGWWIWTLGSGDHIQHGGDTIGQTAFVGFRRGGTTGVVVLSNARANTYASVTDIGFNLLDSSYSLASIRRPPAVPLEMLRSYFGRYKAADGTSFDIGLRHEHLTFAFSGDRGLTFTLYPETTRRFLVLEPGITASATFSTNALGVATSMIWNQGGNNSSYFKQSIASSLTLVVAGGEVRLTLGGNSGKDYVIEASDDLERWTTISTNTIWSNPIIDRAPSNASRRFYRALTPGSTP